MKAGNNLKSVSDGKDIIKYFVIFLLSASKRSFITYNMIMLSNIQLCVKIIGMLSVHEEDCLQRNLACKFLCRVKESF